MLSDPTRLALGPASMVQPPPADGGPALGPDEAAPIPGNITFAEFLSGLNPLQHLPVIGTIYRAATGDQAPPAMRVLGGAIFGGPVGMLISAVTVAIEQFRPVERLIAVARGEPDPAFPDPAAARRAAQAYAAVTHGGA